MGKIQTKEVQDKFEKKVLPTIYKKETLQTQEIKGQVHKEIVRTSVIKEVIKSSVKPEIVRKSVLRASIRQGSGVATEGLQGMQTTTVHGAIDLGTKVHDTIDLGTTNLGLVDTGVNIKKTIDLGTTNLGVVDTGVHLAEGQMTTSVNQAIDMGTKVLPPVTGSTVNLGTIGTTQVTTTTTGVEGPAFGSGAVGYGTSSLNVGQTNQISATQQIGVEGSGLGEQSAVGYGTTSIPAGQVIPNAPEATYGMGVEGSAFPSVQTSNVQGNQVISTISPSFLPNAFNSVQPQQVENQQITA